MGKTTMSFVIQKMHIPSHATAKTSATGIFLKNLTDEKMSLKTCRHQGAEKPQEETYVLR